MTGAVRGARGLGLEAHCIMEWMIADLEELRERISGWPEEQQAAALFALEVIEDELAAGAMNVDETAPSSPVV